VSPHRLVWTEESCRIGGVDLMVLKAGRGKPLLILHEEMGHPGALRWHEELAADRTLVAPLHPGFGRMPRIEWISSVRDLAGYYAAFVRAEKLAPVDVVGISFGGWIAAEMLAADPGLFSKIVLVAPPGIRPPQGEIFDLFRVTAKKFVQATVTDPARTPEFESLYGGSQTPEQFEAWEDARAEIARLAWSPYLFNPSLPHLLELVAAPPTLVVWGREDAIVPPSAAAVYARCIPGAKQLLIDGCGHRPEIEAREQFVESVSGFLRA
jgi:pimeloyl-ACP methyl ester carboxylesterase